MKRIAFLVLLSSFISAFAEDAYWTYDSAAGTITDGLWTFNATVSGTQMTVKTCTDYPTTLSLLDFAKPVKDANDVAYTIKALNTAMVTFSRDGGRPEESTDKGMAQMVGELRLPESGLTSIGTGAFCRTANCTNVVNYLPDSVTSLGNSAFAYCGAKKDLFLRGFVGAAGRGIFYSSKITSVTFGPAFTTMGDISNKMAPFQSCGSITNIVFDPASSGITLPQYSFRANITLKQPLILYGVTSINNAAFSNCKVSSITFDDGIQSIGTLSNVSTLTEVHFLGAPPSSQTGTWADYNYNQNTATVKTYIPWKFRQQWWPYAAEYNTGTTYSDSNAPIRLEGKTPMSTFSSTYATTPAKRPLYLEDMPPQGIVILFY